MTVADLKRMLLSFSDDLPVMVGFLEGECWDPCAHWVGIITAPTPGAWLVEPGGLPCLLLAPTDEGA